jgi:hypothetical protein
MVLLYHFHYAMDNRLYFESLEKLSHKDTWVHYYFVYYKTFCRLSVTCDSFIPSTIRQWNSLNPSLRNVESIAKFKTELGKQNDIRQVPKHYEIGPRKLTLNRWKN